MVRRARARWSGPTNGLGLRGMALCVMGCAGSAAGSGADPPALRAWLTREVITPESSLAEVRDYAEARVPEMPEIEGVEAWQRHAERVRQDVLDRVVFRGEARAWRDAETRVEWLGDLEGGPGYHLRKLRYEALPGLWIPAVLYVPDELEGDVPVALAFNGHEANGMALDFKQIRCINQVKRGMLVLNVEWYGMGQLRSSGFRHSAMNQLDLCGTAGLAPFYLAMTRGLDVLLRQEHADPDRVAVSGLSGGGWQTILLSALDERVTLANPVAGYSSFRTRARVPSDLGDSEQLATDLGAVGDYALLTALRAPRPTLLTYNLQDDCCFQPATALPPLLEAAAPIFSLYGREGNLRTHINDDPGTHNFGLDNRRAFYRMLGDSFFADQPGYSAEEIPSGSEIKTAEELGVELPADNADFHRLALSLAVSLPRSPELPNERRAAEAWQRERRARLAQIVRAHAYEVEPRLVGEEARGSTRARFWQMRMGEAWTVPVVEITPEGAEQTVLLVADGGRRSVAPTVERLLNERRRVLAVDPFYFGESAIAANDYQYALLVSAMGDRPLGLQASQVAAIARWARSRWPGEPVSLQAVGPRSSLFALVAAGLEPQAITGVALHGSLGSLHEVLEQDMAVEQAPELFCFGLLESFDIVQLAALAAPRPLTFENATHTGAFSELKAWYSLWGRRGDVTYGE